MLLYLCEQEMQGQVQFYNGTTMLALKPSYTKLKICLGGFIFCILFFLILSNGEVILSILRFTIRYVGWKIKVQLEVDLIFHYISRKKNNPCNSFSFPLRYCVVSSGSQLHAVILSAIALASSLLTTSICICLLCQKNLNVFQTELLCVNVFLVLFLTNKKTLVVSYEIAIIYSRSQRKLSLSLKPLKVGVILKTLMECKLYGIILITHILMLLIFGWWLWLSYWVFFFFSSSRKGYFD